MSAHVAAAAAASRPRARSRSTDRVGQRTRSVRVTARAVGLGLTVLLVLTLAIAPARSYLKQRGQLADLARHTQQLEQENIGLQGRVAQLRDPAYLERLARQCLGMVRPGEIAFVAVPQRGAPVPPSC